MAHGPPLGEPADLIILTEQAFKVAAGEEDRSRAAPVSPLVKIVCRTIVESAQNRLFAIMQEGTGNGGFGSALADSGFDFSPVNPAFPRTEDAVRLERLERFERPLDPANLFRSIHHEPFYQNFSETEAGAPKHFRSGSGQLDNLIPCLILPANSANLYS